MKFLPYFGVYLTHAYYADGRCLDFRVEPTLQTQRLLRNHRCVLEQRPDGVQVLSTMTEQGDFLIPFRQDAVFTFDLQLQNPDFSRITDLAEFDNISRPLFSNADLSPSHSGELVLTSRVRTLSRTSRMTSNAFAEVEIHYKDGLFPNTDDPNVFYVVFKAKRVRWIYYVVTDLNFSDDAIQIVDSDVAPVVFSEANRRDLNREPASSDRVAQQLAVQYPNLRRFRFVSDELVPCQQMSRKQIHVYLDGTRVAGALPNPSVRHAATIAIDSEQVETAPEQDVLFHIVKLITYPFPSMGG